MSLSRLSGSAGKKQWMHSFQPIFSILFSKNYQNSLQVTNNSRDCYGEKEAPLCTFLKGSYTVEAAVCLPIVICVSAFIIYFFQIFSVQCSIQRSLDDAAKIVAVCADASEENEKGQLAAAIAGCNARVLQYHVPLRYIRGGLAGLQYDGSDAKGNYIRLAVHYTIPFPIGIFGRHSWNMYQCSVQRKWVGWDPYENAGEGSYVYVTQHGTAYHLTLKCSYLHPDISAVAREEVGGRRNRDGAKYYACKSCHADRDEGAIVYIAQYGTAYHSSISCAGLRRNIRKILLKDAGQYHPCKKCVRGG